MKLFRFFQANMGKSLMIAAIGAGLGITFAQTLRRLPFVDRLPSR